MFYENGTVHGTLSLQYSLITGEVTQGSNCQDKTDVLDCPENELESMDCVSICQPKLRPQTGNYNMFSAKLKTVLFTVWLLQCHLMAVIFIFTSEILLCVDDYAVHRIELMQ